MVGGGTNQVPLVLAARSLGLRVLVTDMYENPPCRAHADLYEQVDTTDKHQTLRAAERHRVDGIITDQTDVAIPTVAFVAEQLGLRGIGYQTALRFTNKYLMREALHATRPQYQLDHRYFSDLDEAVAFGRSLSEGDEYIVKPVNSQGSKGVSRLTAANAASAVGQAFLESHQRGILVDRYIRGFEYSVEAFTANGVVHDLAITKKYHYDSNDYIDERNTWLADIAPDLEDALFSANRDIVLALGLPFGITHAEFKVSGGRPYLMEIAARGGGGSISSKIVPFLTGFSPAVALLQEIFGQPYAIDIEDYKRRFAVLKFYNFAPGPVRQVHVNRAALEGLLEFTLDVSPGGTIKPVRDSRDRPGYFVVCGTNRAQVLDQERRAEAAVVIEYGT